MVERRPEDYMDAEDLADAAEHQRVQTAAGFAGLGSTEGEVAKRGAFVDLFKTEGETMGVKLLKKMGWREGQGVGPKVRRAARLGGDLSSAGQAELHLFAPENTRMITFVRKSDHKGLGFAGSAKLVLEVSEHDAVKSEDEDIVFGTAKPTTAQKKKKPIRGGIGIGILNDTGSDDEDPYEIGPRISYNKVIGGDKKKKKLAVNSAVKPVFISKKAAAARASLGLRKCHDGRLPLDGFILSTEPDPVTAEAALNDKYRPPEVPEGWKSSKTPTSGPASAGYVSTAEAAKASKLDPKSRAALLGEAPLPGKSVFDFLSSAARDRIAAASGKSNLPAALGEVPEGYAMTPEERRRELLSQIPKVDTDVAVAALGRGASGWMPYSDDESKRARYRGYLEIQAGIRDGLPENAPNISKDDWLKELHEFAHCAQIFKPMTGMMATRFTSSSSTFTTASANDAVSSGSLLSKPEPKPEDPAEAAAKVGMFGRMTRSEQDFYPTRLLCKRFGVHPPAHVQPDPDREGGPPQEQGPSQPFSKSDIDDLIRESSGVNSQWSTRTATASTENATSVKDKEVVIDVERNEALEGEKAGEAVFKAIFGDDSDED
jgi:G patch domain-containing protein 1